MIVWKRWKKSCYNCGSFSIIKWGFRNNKQRFKCKECGLLFFWRNDHKKIGNQFIWFKKWILEREVYKTLSRDKGQSKRTIQRLFKKYLSAAPSFKIRSKQRSHLIIDGTYFTNELCLVLYYDNDIKYVQLYRFSDRERFEEIAEDLQNLKQLGVDIDSITCDGHKALLKAIRKVFPDVLIQRCLVHIQRMSLLWLTSRPKSDCARDLLALSQQLCRIQNLEESYYWMVALWRWEQTHLLYINQKTINPETGRHWYKHKMIRRVRFLLIKAMPNMFHFLQKHSIPKSTNAIEGYFSHLKNHLNIHRGLTLEHRKSFIKWYLHFKNSKQ